MSVSAADVDEPGVPVPAADGCNTGICSRLATRELRELT